MDISECGDIVESTQQNLVHSLPTSSQHYDEQPPSLDFSAPPPYEDCNPEFVRLPPTYEEVLIETGLEEAMSSPILSGRFVRRPPSIGPPPQEITAETSSVLTFDDGPNSHPIYPYLLGRDIMFLITIWVALLLPVLGFLFLVCLCSSNGASCGAIAEFELTTINYARRKRSAVISDSSTENNCTWIWWTLIAYGIFGFIYAFKRFLNIRCH